jgi:hypothetical protein
MGLLFIPQVIQEYGEPQWIDIDSGKANNLEKNLSQCHSVHHKSHLNIPLFFCKTRATTLPKRDFGKASCLLSCKNSDVFKIAFLLCSNSANHHHPG